MPDEKEAGSLSARGTVIVAVAGVLAYALALILLNPNPIADERLHLRVIRQFSEGDLSAPDYLPMLPGYHLLACVPARFFGASLLTARVVSVAFSLAAVGLLAGIARSISGKSAGEAILRFAWLPLMFPFWAMAYTEAASIAFLAAGLWLALRGLHAWSFLPLLVACLVRQSNVAWVVLLLIWVALESRRDQTQTPDASNGGSASFKRLIARTWAYGLVVVMCAVLFAWQGGFGPIPIEANRPRFNPAQFYLFGLTWSALMLPVWVSQIPETLRSLARLHARNSRWGWGIGAAAVVGCLVLIAVYENPHPWNRGDGFIRNLPLMAMEWSMQVRSGLVVILVATAIVTIRLTAAQAHARRIAALWFFVCAYLAVHSLAEPRYYIVPMMLLNVLYAYPPGQVRALTVWYAVLSLAIALVTCTWGSATGGVW